MNDIMFNDLFDEYIAHSDLEELVSAGIPFSDAYDEIYGLFLKHYGMPRRSGRYPWGSGENPQRNRDFLSYAHSLQDKGFTPSQIAQAMGMSTTDYNALKSLAVNQVRAENIAIARKLKDKGMSTTAIGEQMGVNESTVRGWLKPGVETRANRMEKTADRLKELVDEKGFIDIGKGVELEMGISKETLDTAASKLELEGYAVHTIKVEQMGNPGKYTYVKVLAPPGTEWKDVNNNKDKIHSVTDYSPDRGETYIPLLPPESISSDRVAIKYGDKGGAENDGLIEIRRGVPDVSLGNSRYAQVRILVDGDKYMKGMATYVDDLPEGVDIRFNTNKASGTPLEKVLKEAKRDKVTGEVVADDPFGALIKANGQTYYYDKDGNEHISVVNKIKAEGDWDAYSKNLASQFLSKQPLDLVKRQLKLSYADKYDEFEEINSLTLPSLKKELLLEFADECDSASVTLKAASLPGQSTKVLIPVNTKDGQCYCPSLKDGTEVALVRYPHAGTFEIPKLVVNNKDANGQKLIPKDSLDAIGINSKTAQQLSGADFDGDTVIAIPLSSKVKINNKTGPEYKTLLDFDPKTAYPGYEGMAKIKPQTKQNEMGKVSNLITDMTIQGAPESDIVRAVKHSMVVIDSEKHGLNYKLSEQENGIAQLKLKWQGKTTGGASTLISRAGSEVRDINERKEFNPNIDIDRETGEKKYRETGRTYVDKKTGKVKVAKESSTRMAEAKDAFELSSGTATETLYANYANQLKALANESRKNAMAINNTKRDPQAAKVYADEVASLNKKLNTAKMNAPKERQAQVIANVIVDTKIKDNPDLKNDKDALKKVKTRALNTARDRVGAHKKDVYVDITDNEWNAIKAGAVSGTKMSEIFSNADKDKLKERAMPRQNASVSNAKVNKIKAMSASGYTIADIAEATGLSPSTVSKHLN